MTIRYLPRKLLGKIAPASKIDKLIKGNLTPNKAALSFLSDVDFLDQKAVERVALKTIKQYRDKFDDIQDQGVESTEAFEEAVNENTLLVNRVQNNIVNQIAGEIKDQYKGEFYKWLPSDAETPDPLHQLNYGRKFQIGKGEMPGERYGCRCGMAILVSESQLDL